MSLYARNLIFSLIGLFNIISCNLSVHLPLFLLRHDYSHSVSLETFLDSTLQVSPCAVTCRHSCGEKLC